MFADDSKYSKLVHSISIVPTYTMSSEEQNQFRADEVDILMLGNIFQQLRQLKNVQIGRALESDKLEPAVQSLLTFHPAPQTRVTARFWVERAPHSTVSSLTHAFHVLIRALSTSGKQLEKIGAGFEPYGKGDRNSIDHLVLQLPDTRRQLTRSLFNVRALRLPNPVHPLVRSLSTLKELKFSWRSGTAATASIARLTSPIFSSRP